MKTTAITIIVAGSLLGATAALARGTNVGAIHTNPGVGAIHTNPGAFGTNPGAIGTNPGAIGNGSVPFQSLQPLTGGQGLGYSEPVTPGDTGLNNPTGSD